MATYTGQTKNSASWSAQSKQAGNAVSLIEGSPMGLLLSLTYPITVISTTTWAGITKNSASWTGLTKN